MSHCANCGFPVDGDAVVSGKCRQCRMVLGLPRMTVKARATTSIVPDLDAMATPPPMVAVLDGDMVTA